MPKPDHADQLLWVVSRPSAVRHILALFGHRDQTHAQNGQNQGSDKESAFLRPIYLPSKYQDVRTRTLKFIGLKYRISATHVDAFNSICLSNSGVIYVKHMTVLAIASALLSMQVTIPASAEDEIRHEEQQPTSGQEYTQRSSTNETNSNKAADQAPRIGHIGKDQTQGFRFGSGSRF